MGTADTLLVGGLVLGAFLFLPKFLQEQSVRQAFSLGAIIQRQITGGLTFAESLSGYHTTLDAKPNVNSKGYIPPKIAASGSTFYQDASGKVYVDGRLIN